MVDSVAQWGTLKNFLVDRFVDSRSVDSDNTSESYEASKYESILLTSQQIKYTEGNSIGSPQISRLWYFKNAENIQRTKFMNTIRSNINAFDVEHLNLFGAYWGKLVILETFETALVDLVINLL